MIPGFNSNTGEAEKEKQHWRYYCPRVIAHLPRGILATLQASAEKKRGGGGGVSVPLILSSSNRVYFPCKSDVPLIRNGMTSLLQGSRTLFEEDKIHGVTDSLHLLLLPLSFSADAWAEALAGVAEYPLEAGVLASSLIPWTVTNIFSVVFLSAHRWPCWARSSSTSLVLTLSRIFFISLALEKALPLKAVSR